jgi:hypothetical protein
MRLEGRSNPAAGAAQKSKWLCERITRMPFDKTRMYDTLHLPARLVPRLRETSLQPPSFRQRIATSQERDECLFGLPQNDLSTFATTHSC